MFVGTFWALTRNRRVRDANRPMAMAAILLLILSTAVGLIIFHIQFHPLKSPKHMIVDIVHVENGFVKYRDTFPGGPVVYFADISQPLCVTNNLILTLQTMVGDGVLVGSIFCLPYYDHLSSSKYNFYAKDLSLFCRLAIYMDYRPTKHAVVLRRRLGQLCSGNRML